MISENQSLIELIEEGKKKGYIPVTKLLEIVDEDSEEFDEVIRELEKENIDLVKDEELADLESQVTEVDTEDDSFEPSEDDSDFTSFSSEIEKDIKSKDIDDLVSNIVTPTQSDDPIKMYLKEIGQIELLTTIQELDLSRKVQDALLAEEKLSLEKEGKL